MPRKSSRARRRKSSRKKSRKPTRAKPKRSIRAKARTAAPRLRPTPSTQSAELIWKEIVSPQIAPDIETLDKNMLMLEEERKQAADLVAWADRHSKRFEAYVLTAISSLNAQAAFEATVLKVLLLRLGGIMVDFDIIAGKGTRSTPPELADNIQRLREIILKMIETNESSIEAAKKLMMYF